MSDDCYDDLVIGSSSINLKDGEQMSLDDIMYAIAISSANEAANALASHLFGSVPDFVAKMNEKQRSLVPKTRILPILTVCKMRNTIPQPAIWRVLQRRLLKMKQCLNICPPLFTDSPTNKTPESVLVTTNSLMRKTASIIINIAVQEKPELPRPPVDNLCVCCAKGRH